MARTQRERPAANAAPWRHLQACAVLLFAVEVVVLPGAASPFRLPKMALALAGLAAIGALAAAASRGALNLRRGPLTAVVAALPLLAAVSALWADSPRVALLAAAGSAVWAAATIALASLEAADLEKLARAAGWGAAASAGFMVFQFLGTPLFPVEPAATASRLQLTGLTGNPADLAMALLLPLPVMIAALLGADGGRRRWLLPAVLVAAALATRTLTAVVAVGLLAAVVLLSTRSRRLRRIVAAALVLAAVVVPFTQLGTRVARASRRIASGDWYRLLSARADGWSAGIEMIAEHPGLGVGAGHFDRAYFPARVAWLDRHGGVGRRGELATHFEHAHCEPLQVVAELGLPGAVWLLALAAAVGWHLLRRQSSPVWLLLAVALPFALLHYPLRLAVGLAPLALAAAALLRDEPSWSLRAPRRLLTALGTAVATAVVIWQLGRITGDRWRGAAEQRLVAAERMAAAARVPVLLDLEREAEARAAGVSPSSGDLWRVVGRARLLRGDPAAAAAAFRTAHTLWPHEEAEFGLGLALAAQGRRTEAVARLGRVCRTNPNLLGLINDPSLRTAVEDLVAAARARAED